MYTQIFLVPSVRGIDFPPQTAANAGLRVFGAKSPTPFFFIAAATLLPDAFDAVLPSAFFVALSALVVALVTVGFFVVVVATVFVVAVFVILIKRMTLHASVEP